MVPTPRLLDFRQNWTNWINNSASVIQVADAALKEHKHSRSTCSLWTVFDPQTRFAEFFHDLATVSINSNASWSDRAISLEFMCLSFRSLEVALVRKEVAKLVAIGMWSNLSSDARIQLELDRAEILPKLWRQHQRKIAKASSSKPDIDRLTFDNSWVPVLVCQVIHLLADFDMDQSEFLCQALKTLVILESQLPSRRFVHALLLDHGILSVLEKTRSLLDGRDPVGRWCTVLITYLLFNVHEHTGEMYTLDQAYQLTESRINQFQRLIFLKFHTHFPELALVHLTQLQDHAFLKEQLDETPMEVITDLVHALVLRSTHLGPGEPKPLPKEALIDVLIDHIGIHVSPLENLNQLPLFPVTSDTVVDAQVPPLSLQYMSMSDYLYRHYALYRKESQYAIRQDVHNAVVRLRPTFDMTSDTFEFNGRSRMALAPHSCTLSLVGRPSLDSAPSQVDLEVRFDLRGYRREVGREWDSISRGEVVFLVCISNNNGGTESEFVVDHIRAGFIDVLLAHDGRPVLADRTWEQCRTFNPDNQGQRLLRIHMDRHQYQADLSPSIRPEDKKVHAGDIYGSFNVLVRRNPRENNFWAVLEGIRECSTQDSALPEWLSEVFLGYGDPASVHYSRFDENRSLYFHDTFLDRQHLEDSFPGKIIEYDGISTERLILEFSDTHVCARQLPLPFFGPFQKSLPVENKIRFTPTQVDAIRSGTSRGVSLVVGPPGTGKTDVAVQILCNLYHGNPNERILLLTHSSQVLNQLFEKLLQLNHIPERHLLRLGTSDNESMSGWSQYGRVSHFMERRTELLAEFDKIAKSLNIPGNHAFSCETASSFFKYHVEPMWHTFTASNAYQEASFNEFVEAFPFTSYFTELNAGPLFEDVSMTVEGARKIADGCWSHLKAMQDDVCQSRALEVLKSDRDKANLLIGRDARIVAMTTTYAALKRRDLIELAFEFDTLMMEEAATVLEIEAFIPLSLSSKVKRVVLIGDPHQLPPVIQCPDLAGVAESLYMRLLRLGVPSITLNAQGRSRKSICSLYQHVYQDLSHLSLVEDLDVSSNPGFVYDYQFVNVPDFQGQGEVRPLAGVYQNVGEAEYIVAMYQYMRLLGYPAQSVVILTTYNGQRELILEVMSKRCAWNPVLFPMCHVTTVDRYQGQQNDYVLLSLVRTRHVGHFADLRRMVVAISRARLGLYVFGRYGLFKDVVELQPTFEQFGSRPLQLALLPAERYLVDPLNLRPNGSMVDSEQLSLVQDLGSMVELVSSLAQQLELENMADSVDDDTEMVDV